MSVSDFLDETLQVCDECNKFRWHATAFSTRCIECEESALPKCVDCDEQFFSTFPDETRCEFCHNEWIDSHEANEPTQREINDELYMIDVGERVRALR